MLEPLRLRDERYEDAEVSEISEKFVSPWGICTVALWYKG